MPSSSARNMLGGPCIEASTAPPSSAAIASLTVPRERNVTSRSGSTPLRSSTISVERRMMPPRPVMAICLPRRSRTEAISGRPRSRKRTWLV